ncbi:Rieske (2Fe-2S) protein [Nocardioides mangrovi]|uniref:Cytochrome bc1 complex Rieske iron-sulfur subunit n=1 Tax=Nocardioides mangrovi TaxID=2874580 RepID=A0ABS7UIG9_9ACTN|nr:Rieske (2Fe-2S) protein [Nocardioides mangrovi]MBZ5739998.1 Rieske (2Fe-2S) protein [Nocardioides mangrovi]MBZ5740831.1 Rieske (2Fe-2S) protein [Nocardioides mangrovi]
MHRRSVLGGAAAVGLGLPLLAACGSDGSGEATDPSGATESPTESATASASESPTKEATPHESTSSQAADGLVATADVPVGGGTILTAEKLVVTQPSKGDFKCFTAVCTHQGCVVSSVSDGTINCGCHGSQFSIEDGSVVTGPATSALSAVDVSVDSGSVVES